MGVEPFLISATLEAVLGQRLLRRICSDCSTVYQPNDKLLGELDLLPNDWSKCRFYYGKGCEKCNQTGYRGRIGVYELMRMNDPLRTLITKRAPSVQLKEKAIELGMVTLRQNALRSLFEGHTTIDEVLRYT
jgi:type IV pilus assembly protein PilB